MVAHASSGEPGSMITCDVSAMVKPRDVSVRCSGESVASVSRRAIGPWSSDRRPRVGCATGVASLHARAAYVRSIIHFNVHVHLYACNILRALQPVFTTGFQKPLLFTTGFHNRETRGESGRESPAEARRRPARRSAFAVSHGVSQISKLTKSNLTFLR